MPLGRYNTRTIKQRAIHVHLSDIRPRLGARTGCLNLTHSATQLSRLRDLNPPLQAFATLVQFRGRPIHRLAGRPETTVRIHVRLPPGMTHASDERKQLRSGVVNLFASLLYSRAANRNHHQLKQFNRRQAVALSIDNRPHHRGHLIAKRVVVRQPLYNRRHILRRAEPHTPAPEEIVQLVNIGGKRARKILEFAQRCHGIHLDAN